MDNSEEQMEPDETGRVPASAVLAGLRLHPLEPDERPVEAYVLMKVEDTEGRTGWSMRTTAAPNREEMLGVLQVQVQLLLDGLIGDWDVD